ncbi:putative RND multidrug efflux membrane fusion protein MexC [Candidatus Kuenenia stuttgartiensis]|jgi:HlyD family secretion protein|uniref:Putative RND multidrug efflux membrane fusion protein MexC n=1 Tax=Kuenenia stuttgartiensis TaxID=174633 RepID=Q1PZ46_KUEST|nr:MULTISPECIES: efflux RND transporter periplasmic adaptor subunit [Kuenenia]MBE7547397.1 efflux RND transporter periplasmic adaptor subunit [Planctomycetia bacterium]MBZ0190622.1 efflux RND transporter periplasmic adaptor subunit [Candidatus Kuenenia stuttgartiensis]MCF6151791.1 efflux RND transporter periplasmic adaptor subunit [Candidatus Kuenenia stuttgartiensis]MCL4726343.1 efflux RND transporter periplasmic adaptor subunit [Candidatus Kuenenia stuttgartiensis]MCZ7623790.1 efflux RND tra
MKKYIYIGIPCVLVIIVTVIYLLKKEETVRFETAKIVKGDIQKYVVATGTINPVRTVIIGSQVSGLISKLYADFNSEVKTGQIVAQIDPTPFEHQVRKAEAALATALAKLKRSNAVLRNSKRKYHRAKKLFSTQVISIDEFDESRTVYETSLADAELAKAEIMQAEASLAIAKTDLGYTVIVSPLDGIVISREVDVGQTVASSFQTPTLFTIAKDLVSMQVNTNVDEADIGMVEVGQSARFNVDAFPEDVFDGKVTEIRMSPVIFQNVVTYDTIVSIDNSSLKLKPGMTANTSILVAEAKNVLSIPNTALRFTPSKTIRDKTGKPEGGEYDGEKYSPLWILKHGKPVMVMIKTGISDYDFTEIVGGEVKEGDEVVVAEITDKSAAKSSQQIPWTRMGGGRR